MPVLWIVIAALAVLWLGAGVYSRWISRVLGEDAARETPALSQADGYDFVSTPTPVVFAHHFASIAGTGPIIGAVHDYSTLFVSLREKGRSIGTICRNVMGPGAFLLFIFLLIALLALVTTVAMLLRLLFVNYLPNLSDPKLIPLLITDIIVLLLTGCLLYTVPAAACWEPETR